MNKKCLFLNLNLFLLYIYLVQKSKCYKKIHMTNLTSHPIPIHSTSAYPLSVIVFISCKSKSKEIFTLKMETGN